MRDIRIDRWADVLVNYALQAKEGQHAIVVSEIESLPLLEACYEKLIKAKAIVEPLIIPRSFSEMQFKYASDAQIATPPPLMKYAAENCDLYLMIGAEINSKLLANVSPQKQALAAKGRLPIMNAIMERAAAKKVSWVYTHFPTPQAAQDAEMGTREYEELIFSLGHLNKENPIAAWKQVEENQKLLIHFLESKKELHFRNAQGTDLTVNIDGMKWVNCSGRINFPDGEVYTGPNLNTKDGGVNGVARFSLPTIYRNVEVQEMEMHFEKGKVIQAKASKGQDFLREMLNLDEGAKRMGEIAIGTNYNFDRVTKNILFDEKLGGTFHFALGKGYPQTGNTNQSALHWDMIFDLKNGGSIKADGELFYQEGKFLDPKLVF